MRATYEDLLRAARRTAVSALRGRYPDESEVLQDWEAVLAATTHHLRWLRCSLRTERGELAQVGCSDNALGRLARAIGAGADLLAVQDSAAAAALDVRDDLIAARAEVAVIALMGARVVVRNTLTRASGRTHLKYVMGELEQIAAADVRRAGLGGLGRLAAGGPATASGSAMIAPRAARWERAQASPGPEHVLSRDLRSTTAQLRTVGGQVWHMTTHLLSSPSAGLEASDRLDLQTIRRAMRRFDSGSFLVDRLLRQRLSDLNGPTSSLGEVAFQDLKDSVDALLRDDRGLHSPRDLAPNHRSAVQLIDSVDELLWSAERVARRQLDTVNWMIGAGRLFVPRREAVHVDVSYLRRPGGGARFLQQWWVRTDRVGCFEELTVGLADAADCLKVASNVARRLAGTSSMSRRTAEPCARAAPPHIDELSGIADPGQELADLSR